MKKAEKKNTASQDDTITKDQMSGKAGTEADPIDARNVIEDDGAAVENVETAVASEPQDTVETLRDKVAALDDQLLRAKAEFLNAQRRQEKARHDAIRYANADLMRSLLGVLDDFDRTLDAARKADDTEAVVEGVRLVYENLKKELKTQGLEEINAIDQPFDPHVHEAVLQQPVADCEPNTVIEQLGKGFRLHDRVLRPAKVIVSKAAEEHAAEDGVEKEV